jgi:hypothetical protein
MLGAANGVALFWDLGAGPIWESRQRRTLSLSLSYIFYLPFHRRDSGKFLVGASCDRRDWRPGPCHRIILQGMGSDLGLLKRQRTPSPYIAGMA